MAVKKEVLKVGSSKEEKTGRGKVIREEQRERERKTKRNGDKRNEMMRKGDVKVGNVI